MKIATALQERTLISSLPPRRARVLKALAAVMAVGLVVLFAVDTLGVPGLGLNSQLDLALWLAGPLVCFLRVAWVSYDRPAWLMIGAGLLTWTLAQAAWAYWIDTLSPIPYPSIADGMWFIGYLLLFIGLGMLAQRQLAGAGVVFWLDGAIATLAAIAFTGAFTLNFVSEQTQGSYLDVATNFAYPIFDVVLLSVVVLVVARTNWRPGRTWAMLAFATVALVVVDYIYSFQVSAGTYASEGPIDPIWTLVQCSFGMAAWLRPAPTRSSSRGD